jgi:hypothetical protein
MKWPKRARRGAASGRATVALALLVLAACGGHDAPNDPGRPSPSPTAPQPGGDLTGRYVLQVTPSAQCPMHTAVSFPMTAAAAGASPYPGVQVILAGSETLEGELQGLSPALVSGGFGTTDQGVLANEGLRLWIRAIASGPVVRAGDGRGQVLSGRMAGYVALGFQLGPEGSLGSCDALDHAFVLRTN